MRHVFLSPHLDDAVLSCGGTISSLTAQGEPVLVVTLFSGETSPPYSSLALSCHVHWGSPPDVVALRRAEDMAAQARLGAIAQHEDIPDAIYRRDRDGRWIYGDTGVFLGSRGEGAVAYSYPDDAWIPAYVRDRVRSLLGTEDECRVYAPLGIGHHVDHLLGFDSGQLLSESGYHVSFYEDFPYSSNAEAYRRRSDELLGWTQATAFFSVSCIAAKVDAFGYYRSQIAAVFPKAEYFGEPIQLAAQALGTNFEEGGERYWSPPPVA